MPRPATPRTDATASRADAWQITNPQLDTCGQWRAKVLRRSNPIGGLVAWRVAWTSLKTYPTRSAAMSIAKEAVNAGRQ